MASIVLGNQSSFDGSSLESSPQRLKFYSCIQFEKRKKNGLSVVPHCKAVTLIGFSIHMFLGATDQLSYY